MRVENISHTAHWMAYVRALESDRPNPLFHDPYSRKLAGKFGEEAANTLGSVAAISNSVAVRTAVLDRLILDTVAQHDVDLVLNIGSGLDTRPWRLQWPPNLRWRDIDLPELLQHKARVLAKDPPTCRYEAFPANILRSQERADALTVSGARRIVVVTEGLLVYLRPAEVETLALDLHQLQECQWWLTDLVGPRALPVLRNVWAPKLPSLGFHFAPADGPGFFARLGWREVAFLSAREEARRLKRPLPMSCLAKLGLMLGTPSFREEFRRLAGVASFARMAELQIMDDALESAVPTDQTPNTDFPL